MSRRRRRTRSRRQAAAPVGDADLFSEVGVAEDDFDVVSGTGKSLLAGQRIVWMKITQRSTGKQVSGRIGTTKRAADTQRRELLRSLLKKF